MFRVVDKATMSMARLNCHAVFTCRASALGFPAGDDAGRMSMGMGMRPCRKGAS